MDGWHAFDSKVSGVRPVPSTEQTGVSEPQTSGRETPGGSKGKGSGKRIKDSDGPSTSGGDGGRKDGGGVASKAVNTHNFHYPVPDLCYPVFTCYPNFLFLLKKFKKIYQKMKCIVII